MTSPTAHHNPGRSPSSGLGAAQLRSVLIPHAAYRTPAASPRASVAAVFRTGEHDTDLLFIQRAERDGDPWSGHMAFPGGRADAVDADSHATAERETAEELGLDLGPARRLGSLTDAAGGRATNNLIAVSAHCYWIDGERPPLEPNYEVAAAAWVPVGHLLDRRRYIDYWYGPSASTFPGIQLDVQEQVVWGLTLRFLADLFTRLDKDFIV